MRTAINKRLVIITLSVVGVLILAFVTYLLMRPRVTVVAPSGSTIAITNLQSGDETAQETTEHNSTTIAVPSGSYAVTVINNQSKETFYVSLATFQDKKLSFSNTPELHTAIVARQIAYQVIRQGKAIVYLDTTGRAIERMDENGNRAALDSTNTISSLQLREPGQAQILRVVAGNSAVAFTNGVLYSVQNGRLRPLDTSGMSSDRSTVTIATNPSQTEFVVGIGQTLYWYNSVSAKPQKVMTLSKQFDQLAFGGSKVIAYSTRMPNAVEDIRYAYSLYAVNPLIVDISKKTESTFTQGAIVDASISPDGMYATVRQQGSDTTGIYSLSDNQKLYDMESPDTTTPNWLDGTHFTYGKDADVWSADVSARTVLALGTLPNGQQPTSVTYDAADKIYYVTAYTDSNTAAIYKLSPNTVSNNAALAATLDVANQTTPDFLFSYIDITRPTLRIVTNVLSNNPSETSYRTGTFQSRQAALSYLKKSLINTDGLIIVYDPANP